MVALFNIEQVLGMNFIVGSHKSCHNQLLLNFQLPIYFLVPTTHLNSQMGLTRIENKTCLKKNSKEKIKMNETLVPTTVLVIGRSNEVFFHLFLVI